MTALIDLVKTVVLLGGLVIALVVEDIMRGRS